MSYQRHKTEKGFLYEMFLHREPIFVTSVQKRTRRTGRAKRTKNLDLRKSARMCKPKQCPVDWDNQSVCTRWTDWGPFVSNVPKGQLMSWNRGFSSSSRLLSRFSGWAAFVAFASPATPRASFSALRRTTGQWRVLAGRNGSVDPSAEGLLLEASRLP